MISIAIDGPAGAGKSSVARAVAERMNIVYLDTGAMYRTVALYMQSKGYTEDAEIAAHAEEVPIDVRFENGEQHMLLDGVDVTDKLRTPEASMLASRVGAIARVREVLVALQQRIARSTPVVMDGRDIGTVVLPDAPVKIFLTASAEVRAERRLKELRAAGRDADPEQVLKEIIERDYNDSHRAASPMRPAEDSVILDTSDMSKQAVIDRILEIAGKVEV
ncbi:MAG: (d)CMP kinase [Clostridia bacterium]|nr:(d)CMP kinase [Clostridia bacterium]